MKKKYLFLIMLVIPLWWSCGKEDIPANGEEEEEEDPEIEIVDDKPLPSTGERQENFLFYGGGLLLLGALFLTYDLSRKTKKKS